ncbi:Anthranilate phosphoribosyltransferase [Trichinella spiralis]|uniref:Anthranilate phosphoribosyltransferase n=1 Tax=Trichinella spiralis TaxID=6334 RepID=A0ABR3KGR9_TRISP
MIKIAHPLHNAGQLTAFHQPEFRIGAKIKDHVGAVDRRVSVRVATIFFGHCGPIELTAFDKHRLIGSFYSAKRTAAATAAFRLFFYSPFYESHYQYGHRPVG